MFVHAEEGFSLRCMRGVASNFVYMNAWHLISCREGHLVGVSRLTQHD